MVVHGSNFTANIAEDNGGAIFAKGETTVRDCTFEKNEAGSNGGAMFSALGPSGIRDSSFSLNSALGSGGAVAGVGAFFTLRSATFVGNSAGIDGGALHSVEGVYGQAEFCNFTANTAPNGQGGALFLEADDFQVYSNIFESNTGLLGGAVLLTLPRDHDDFRTTFVEVKFVDNLSLTYGLLSPLYRLQASIDCAQVVPSP